MIEIVTILLYNFIWFLVLYKRIICNLEIVYISIYLEI